MEFVSGGIYVICATDDEDYFTFILTYGGAYSQGSSCQAYNSSSTVYTVVATSTTSLKYYKGTASTTAISTLYWYRIA